MAHAVLPEQHVPRPDEFLLERVGALDVVGEQRDFRAGQRKLLNDRGRDGVFRDFLDERAIAQGVGLVEDVAQENPPEDRRLRRQAALFQGLRVALLQARGLIREAAALGRIDHEEMLDGAVGAFEAARHHPFAASRRDVASRPHNDF